MQWQDGNWSGLGLGMGSDHACIDSMYACAPTPTQVHSAILPDGRRVALKVQYPGVAR